MKRIIIKNIGPIKSVDINLSRVNVFIGPQSGGKSTIAKIISYCSWFEKRTILTTQMPNDFFSGLLSFHNMEKEYFSDSSLIEYSSDWCHIVFRGKDEVAPDVEITISSKNIFHNKKIQYIPAERNFVTIPGVGRYNETKDNVSDFLYNWFEAKRGQNEFEPFSFPIGSVSDFSYFYNEKDDVDVITFDNGKKIALRHASSGLMSVTPLLVVFKYIIDTIYTKERIQSPFEILNIQSKLSLLEEEKRQTFTELVKDILDTQKTLDLYPGNKDDLQKRIIGIQKKMSQALGFDTDYNLSEIIIEEPELNLFPSTQRELIYYLIDKIYNSGREHQLVITTHSPYVLFAINNCMMGGLVQSKVPEAKVKDFPSGKSWIDPKAVGVYEIHNGELVYLQDEDGILKNNYLNKAYQVNSKEYISLLNYYEQEA